MDVSFEKKPVNRFDDNDRKQADKTFGKGNWTEHICTYNGVTQWTIHSKKYHDNDIKPK